MHHVAVIALVLATGCQGMESSGAPFSAVDVDEGPIAGEVASAPAPPGFDFDSDGRSAESEEDTETSEADLYAGLGLGALPPEATEPVPEAPGTDEPALVDAALEPVPEVLPVAAPPAVLSWDGSAGFEGSWGVRVVSTTVESQPPVAVLGLPDGTTEAVQPGTLLPQAGLVVLAIGRDSVQVAEIIPVGDHARVETHILRAMYGQPAPQR